MANDVTIAPENLTIANTYLTLGDVDQTANELGVARSEVTAILNKSEVKRYIDNVYLDTGYRNRFKIAKVLDDIIDEKIEEGVETGMYTKKDVIDLLQIAHKMRMDEAKIMLEKEKIQKQPATNTTNVHVNAGGFEGNYGSLMKKLMQQGDREDINGE